ncbi:MAG TPA: tetratricopeptide repeat protein [Actinophytocola sp.]|uniref:AfsR/SARP family transcriptional regulator n=1 Tax=Actinophytocola sp. TaxID=1872138 RepID=UPI002DB88D69|nr:tetratricopeptide repeat protein [Actinophytocola sp.]HEU5475600.1 tetratricopeptide repeat protein [Actinophytocola sp.]
MEFRLLGPVQIWASGRSFPVGEPRQQAVLAVLLVDAGRTVSVDALVDRVWGEAPPRQVRRSLQAHIARIRRALEQAGEGDSSLVRDAGGYRLDIAPDRVDLLRFRAELARWRTVELADDARAAGLREVLAMWRGEPLSGVGGTWAGRVRRTLQQEYIDAVVSWARAEIRIGNAVAAVGPLTDLADEQPLLEVAAATLMRALYAAGRPSDALSHYDRIRKSLRDELGTDPGPELHMVHQGVLRHDLAMVVGAPPRTAPVLAKRPAPAQLPGDVAAFTGRSDELAELDDLLGGGGAEPPAPVIVCITGTAGVGKTAMAVHWGHRVADRFPDGQLYLDLRGYDPEAPVPPGDGLAAFLSAVAPNGPEIPLGLEERAAWYRTEIAGRRMLIVLDNAATVEQVRPLLPGTATCVTVVTSRDSLAGLVALHGARRVGLDMLPVPDAITLLRRLIGQRVDADPAATAALAERCVRLPLTLRLAAELAVSRSATALADLVAELGEQQSRLDLLSGGSDRRAAISAVFSWSIQHLTPAAARAFVVLGVHPAPTFDVYALAALLDGDLPEVRRLLDALARAHLVHPAGADRYGMHDLLRAYAAHLAGTPADRPHPIDVDARAALGRWHDYYLATAALAMERLHPGESDRRPAVPAPATPAPDLADPVAARNWLDAELANLESAAAHSVAHGWPEHTVRLSAILFRYLDGGHTTSALTLHEHARDAAKALGDRRAEAVALIAVGGTHAQAGRHELAEVHLWQAYTLFLETDDQLGQARALGNIGQVDERTGRYGPAAEHLEQSLPGFRATGDWTGEAHALTRLGAVEARLGREDAALEHLRRALALHQQAGHRFGEAWALAGLGELEAGAGRLDRSADLHGQALALFRQLGHRTSEAWAMDGLGITETLRGRYTRAATLHQQALTLFRENGDRDGEAWSLNGLGEACGAAGQVERSRAHHADALDASVRTGARHQQARAHLGLARAARAADDLSSARRHYEQATETYAELGMTIVESIRAERSALDDTATFTVRDSRS